MKKMQNGTSLDLGLVTQINRGVLYLSSRRYLLSLL